jgi:opacity protein-like surface antigen
MIARKYIKDVVLACIMVFANGCAYGQAFEKYFHISYDVNQPLSNTDFIGNTAKKGFMIGFRQALDEHLLVGADLNYSTYKDYTPRETYQTSSGAFTTDFFRYAYVYGLTLSGDYLFAPDKKLQPYLGLGIGASYIDYTSYYNVFSSRDPRWGVLLRPEGGLLLQMGKYSTWGIQAGVHFDYSTARSKDNGYNNFMNAGFHIGLVFFTL